MSDSQRGERHFLDDEGSFSKRVANSRHFHKVHLLKHDIFWPIASQFRNPFLKFITAELCGVQKFM